MAIKGSQTPPPSFGAAPQQYNQQWAASLTAQLARRLGLLAGPYTIQPQLLLQSPDGTVWQVTVSNAGAITATVATHGIQPPV
jgi:hypothetical protein